MKFEPKYPYFLSSKNSCQLLYATQDLVVFGFIFNYTSQFKHLENKKMVPTLQ